MECIKEEYGHAKEDKGLPVFNYSIDYDCNNREPLFYEGYPGSIVDVSQLQCMLDKAMAYGYKNAGFIHRPQVILVVKISNIWINAAMISLSW